jgi:hypothetical protein
MDLEQRYFDVLERGTGRRRTSRGRRLGLAGLSAAVPISCPDEFTSSFLDRNPVNRAILTTASRRLRA